MVCHALSWCERASISLGGMEEHKELSTRRTVCSHMHSCRLVLVHPLFPNALIKNTTLNRNKNM